MHLLDSLFIVVTALPCGVWTAWNPQIDKIVEETGALFLSMSNVTEEGVSQVKNEACKLLQAHRVSTKMKGKKVSNGCLHKHAHAQYGRPMRDPPPLA